MSIYRIAAAAAAHVAGCLVGASHRGDVYANAWADLHYGEVAR